MCRLVQCQCCLELRIREVCLGGCGWRLGKEISHATLILFLGVKEEARYVSCSLHVACQDTIGQANW